MTRSRSITDTHLRAGRTKELRAGIVCYLTLLDMGGLLPQEEWVTMPIYRKIGDALVVIPVFPDKAHRIRCCSAIALSYLKQF